LKFRYPGFERTGLVTSKTDGRDKVVRHGRYIAFQMAEVAISRHLFADIILRLIAELQPPPDPAPA
jgi:hypothetical protein